MSKIIGDYVELQRGTTYKGALLGVNDGPVLLGLASIARNGGFRTDKLRNYGGKSVDKLLLYPGDIFVSLKDVTQAGDLLGSVARVPKEVKVGRVTQDTVKLIFKNETAPKAYIYWLLRTPQYRNFCRSVGTGTTNLGLSREDFLTYPVPEYTPSRKVLVNTLEEIERKIELNLKMNQTMEEMAQALFKSWFVDFDPVLDNALAAGNEIPEELQVLAKKRSLVAEELKLLNTNPELAAKFPDSFVFNEEFGKWVPEGWENTNLNECLSTISKTYNLKEIEKIIFLNTGDIQEGRFLHNNYSDTVGLPGQAKKSIQKGDILYSEIRPKNKRFAYVFFDSNDYVVSTKLMVLRPKNDIDALFYYQILKSDSTINELQFLAESRSGTFPQITYDTLKAINFVLPNEKEIIKHYSAFLKTNFDRTIEAQKQTETLTKLRDTLLPQLISGKLRVPEAMLKA
jgi:type I restriction enzyme S subunit